MKRFVRRPARRSLSAVLALVGWASLVLLPSRALAECPMVEPAATAQAAALETAPHTGHTEHTERTEQAEPLGHEGHSEHGDMSAPSGATGGEHHAPVHTSCPDLAHCAVAALTAVPIAPLQASVAPNSASSLEPTAPAAPAIAIDTPPPRG